ncbi:COMM domain-containing protein 5-like [Plutella xylostella]|uniref:COMM domain-containing protein 5-like n=1 Tax=Plutella xylostella TaxID=51655 RepID=UPI002032753E|nr:COMM domain-containing protein 5-like [Plutella xylostella]
MSQQLELLTENPGQWTAVLYVTPEIQKKEIKPFVALSIKELEGTPDSRTSSLVNVDKFAAVRAVVRHVARSRTATKEPWQLDDVQTFLEGLRFTPECIAELSPLLCADQIYSALPRHLRVLPGLAGLQWRIDVSLSQSNLATATDSPTPANQIYARSTHVILTLQLTDGQTTTYRLSIAKFHELRYVVASCLKSVIVLERRKCMRRD